MKRDMELIRELMLEVESQDRDFNYQATRDKGYNDSQINYHLELLIEAELVEGQIIRTYGGSSYMIKKLSWSGHEFLDSARNESVWKDTMKTVKEKGGSVAVGILTQLLTSAAKQQFGLG